jgi:F-type H+-transporting ATPase subunit epsilon
MKTFTLCLLSADSTECFDDIESFSAEDDSGSFNILARHERFMTVLSFGLAWFRRSNGEQEFLGVPGGILYFRDNTLNISTRRYIRDSNAGSIVEKLTHELLEEEHEFEAMRKKLHRLEAEMVRRLAQLEKR